MKNEEIIALYHEPGEKALEKSLVKAERRAEQWRKRANHLRHALQEVQGVNAIINGCAVRVDEGNWPGDGRWHYDVFALGEDLHRWADSYAAANFKDHYGVKLSGQGCGQGGDFLGFTMDRARAVKVVQDWVTKGERPEEGL